MEARDTVVIWGELGSLPAIMSVGLHLTIHRTCNALRANDSACNAVQEISHPAREGGVALRHFTSSNPLAVM